MSKKILFRKPVLRDFGGDLNEKWYVEYSVPDPARPGKMKRKKERKGLHTIKDEKLRREKGEELCIYWLEKLQNGYNPFINNESVVYMDELSYTWKNDRSGKNSLSFKNFNWYASNWLVWVEKNRAKKTLQTYRSKLRIFNEWLVKEELDRFNVTVIDNEIIKRFWTWLIDERNMHVQTLAKYEQILTAVFRVVIEEIPTYKMPMYKLPESRNRSNNAPMAFVDYDLEKIMVEIRKQPQLYLVTLFEHNCAMRPSAEITHMRVGWINFQRGIVTIPAEYNQKGKKAKHATIPAAMLTILIEKYKLHHFPKDYYLLGKNTGGLPGEEHWGKNYFSGRFNKVRDKLGLPKDYVLYSMKHTGGTRAIDDGLSLRSVSAQMGHSNVETTSRYIENRIVTVDEGYKNIFTALV